MFNMHKKLNTLLMLVIFVIVFLLLQIINMLYSDWLKNARHEMSERAQLKSLMLTMSLTDFNNSLSMLVDNVEILRKNNAADRNLAIAMVKQMLLSHRDIFGVDLVYEPYKFDGRDNEYINHPIYLEQGVFMPYVWKNGYDLVVEWAYKEGEREWYDDVKAKPRSYWSDPKEYDIGNQKKKVLSLFIPIMDVGQFIGVAVADYEIKHFQDFLSENSMSDSNGFIFTETGEEVASNLQLDSAYNKDFLKQQGVLQKIIEKSKSGGNSLYYIKTGFLTDLMVMAYPAGVATAAENNMILCYVVRQPSVTNFLLNSDVGARNYIAALIAFLLLIPVVLRMLKRYGLDTLTQVYTREMIEKELPSGLKAARQNREPISIIMADLDHFKKVNDLHGHLAGDAVLRGFVGILKQNVRKSDWIARYGGEEFLVCFWGANGEKCNEIAERIRKDVEEAIFEYEGAQIQVTVSIGIASVEDMDNPTAQELIHLADKNLYAAKAAGRNKVMRK